MADRLRLEVILAAIDKATGPLKGIMGSASGASEALRKSKAALKGLRTESASIKDFSSARAELRKTTAALGEYTTKAGVSRLALDAQRAAHHQLFGEVKVARQAFKHAGAALKSNGLQSGEAATAYLKQQNALQALETKLNLSKAALSKQTSATKSAEKAAEKLTTKHTEQSAKLTAVRDKLAAAGLSTDKLASRQAQLRTQMQKSTDAIERQEKHAKALAAAHERASRLKSTGMNRFTQGTSMALTGIGATRTAAFPIVAAMEFESSMADVRKVVDFDTPQQFKQMGHDIQDLSTRVPMASEEIAKMVAFAGQALGQDTAKSELLRFAEDAAKMGVAFDMSAEDAGQTMATWRTAFRLPQNDAVKLADQVNYLGNTGPANAQKITGIVTRIGSLGEVAGLQSAPLAALGATIAGMGVQEEVAATGIKNLLLRLNAGGAATKRQQLAFREMGLDAVKVSKGMQVDAKGTILTVLERLRTLPLERQAAAMTQLFGSESVQAIAPLLTNLELLKENLDKVNDAERYGGSMEAEYASRKATTANNITLLKNSVRALAQRIGETLLPTVSELATKASALLGKLAQWAKNNPKVASTLAKIAIAGGVLLTVLGAGIAIFGAAGMALGHIMTMLAPVTGALAGAGVAAGGIAAPLLLIAGVGLLIWKYWDSVKGVFTGLWDGLVAGIQPAIPALEMIRDTLQRILAPTEANADAWAIFAAIGYAVGHVLGTVVTVAVVGLAIAIETLANAFQWVGQFIGNTIGFIVTGLGHLWDVITGIFNGDWGQVMAALQGHWNNINQYFGGLPAKFAEFGINMVQGLVRGITSMLGAPGEALAKVADGTISRLKNLLGIESPSRVFAQLGGFTMAGFTQGLLGGQNGAQNALARIGNGLRTTAAGIAIGTVGVATAGNTVPLDTRPPLAGARGAMATGGGATYNITINATGNTQAQDIARMVRDEIERLERNRAVRNRSELSDYE